MKRHFFFFRHGDRAGIDPESGISELGVCQAHRLGQFLSDKGIEIVYSSPLRRSIDTAKIALNNPSLKVITDERLIETAFGFWYDEGHPAQQRIINNFNRIKSCFDYIVANDLSKIGNGKHWAMILNEKGIVDDVLQYGIFCNTYFR